jgi:hypothetical protein
MLSLLQERDWEASSADEDEDDPRSTAWAALMQQGSSLSQAGIGTQSWDSDQQQEQQQQQPQLWDQQAQQGSQWQVDSSSNSGQLLGQACSRQLSMDVQLLPVDADKANAAAAAAAAAGFSTGVGDERSSLSLVSAVSASAAAAVAIAAAAAVAGPEFGSPELSPGGMLEQRLREQQHIMCGFVFVGSHRCIGMQMQQCSLLWGCTGLQQRTAQLRHSGAWQYPSLLLWKDES